MQKVFVVTITRHNLPAAVPTVYVCAEPAHAAAIVSDFTLSHIDTITDYDIHTQMCDIITEENKEDIHHL